MQMTYLEAIRQGIQEEMERDPDVFLLGEDIGIYGGAFKVTAGLSISRRAARHRHPHRGVGYCGRGHRRQPDGPAAGGGDAVRRFHHLRYDQIVNFAAKCRYRWGAAVPMVIRAPSAAASTAGPFHSQNPEAWFVHTPGLKWWRLLRRPTPRV